MQCTSKVCYIDASWSALTEGEFESREG